MDLIAVFVPTIENGDELCIRLYFMIFLFSTQNQVYPNHWTGLDFFFKICFPIDLFYYDSLLCLNYIFFVQIF